MATTRIPIRFRRLWAAAVACTVVLTARATPVFLEIDGIPGESTDAAHAGWIEIASFRHGLGRMPGGRTEGGELLLTKQPDRASPRLAAAVATGRLLPKVVLELVAAPGRQAAFYRITLTDAVVTHLASETGDPESQTERIRLSYAAASWAYTEFREEAQPFRDHVAYWDFLRQEGGGDTFRHRFQVRGEIRPGRALGLNWYAERGRRYQLLRLRDWNRPDAVDIVGEIEATEDGEKSVEIPTDGGLGLFLIREAN